MNIQCPYCKKRFELAPRRKPSHSRFFHMLCGAYARVSGLAAAKVKVLFKYSYGVWVEFPFQGPPPEWPGAFVVMYKGLPTEQTIYLKSEAAYTKAEENALIEGVKVEAFDMGINFDQFED